MKNPWDIEKKEDKKADDNFSKSIFEKLHTENKDKTPKNYGAAYRILIPIFLLFWLFNGVYRVDSDEKAVVMYFGKFYEITEPGLNFCIPYPIGSVIKVPVTRINQEEFGFNSGKQGSDEESIMLTGDENIADIDFELQWKVGNVKDFVFNVKDQRNVIRDAAESVMREIIATRDIDDVLADKKFEIESDAKTILQTVFDEYKIGVEVLNVQLLRVDPPKEVIAAFRDVQTAKADKEKKINSAKAYSNDILPKARGEAEAFLQNAEAYRSSVVLNAEGEAERFDKIYAEYKLNRAVTKKRIYLETMEEVFGQNNKIIIDKNISGNLINLLKE